MFKYINRASALTALYILVLAIESFFMYKYKLEYYGYCRILSSIILFLFVFKRKQFKSVRLYYYIGLSFTVIADFMTIFLYENLYNIGMSLFIISYISFATIISRHSSIKDRKNIPTVIYALTFMEALLIILQYSISTILDIINIAQLGLHVLVLLLILYWLVKGFKRKKGRNIYFIFSSFLMLFTNIIYALDIYLLNRKYPVVDAIVVMLQAIYLYLLAKGVDVFKNTQYIKLEVSIKYNKNKRYSY